MRSIRMSCIVALLCLPVQLDAQGVYWHVDSASVAFEIRNAGFPVRGSFGGLDANVCFDPAQPQTGRLSGSIDPSTIDTGIGLRDKHLLRRGYFDVKRYGAIDLHSLRLWKTTNAHAGTFLLRIRDVEREVEIPFEFNDSGARATLTGSFTINRLDYRIGKPSVILADDVTVRVDLELSRGGQSATCPAS